MNGAAGNREFGACPALANGKAAEGDGSTNVCLRAIADIHT
jgi:hypothetical protein